MGVFDFTLYRELCRQKDHLIDLIDAINAKNMQKMQDAKKALNAAYRGRGRPTKVPRISREDQARQLKYDAELEVLNAALGGEAMMAPHLLRQRLNEVAQKKLPYEDEGRARTYRKYRDRKIECLLGLLPHEPKPRPPVQPWDEDNIRAYLEGLRDRNRHAVAELNKFPRDTPLYRRELVQAEAGVAVIERFIWSQHLASRDVFLRRAKTLEYEPGRVLSGAVSEEAKTAWKAALAEVVCDLKARYTETKDERAVGRAGCLPARSEPGIAIG
jgi:hypothetical protein